MSNGEGKEGTVFHTKEKMNFIIPIMEKKFTLLSQKVFREHKEGLIKKKMGLMKLN